MRLNTYYTPGASLLASETNTNTAQTSRLAVLSLSDFEVLTTAGEGYFGKVKVAALKNKEK